MGKDITMQYFDLNDEPVYAITYEGRNSEWFANISNRGNDWEYEDFPAKYLRDDDILAEKVNLKKLEDEQYFDIMVLDKKAFNEWYKKRKPYLRAGWVSELTAWKIDKKGYVVDEWSEEVYNYKDSEHCKFIEWENPYDDSTWLYNVLKENPDIDKVVYYFDC